MTSNEETTSDIILHGFPKQENVPSGSGFCQKLETFLRVTETKYTHIETFPHSAPKKKLPYITNGEDTVADSHFIIRYLIEKGISKDLDAHLTPEQQADSRAFQAYIEDLLYVYIVWNRWGPEENRLETVHEQFSQIPWPLRPILSWYFTRLIRNAMISQGVGRHSEDQVRSITEKGVDNISIKIGNGPFFHGDEISEIDCILYGFFATTLASAANPIFRNAILSKENLVLYSKRITEMYFPEYEHVLALLKKHI